MEELNIITASDGNVFMRIHDGVIFGKQIYLGIDFSTCEPREDKREYYIEVPEQSE